MEGWAKVWVASGTGSFFEDPNHGGMSCIDCHGGVDGELTKDEAHVGMNPDPSEGANDSCADLCHNANMGQYETHSLHATQQGYRELIEARGNLDFDTHAAVQAGFATDCGTCHASCGDCHISQPKSVGGGLIDGHRFMKTPDTTRNCTACHGSRVGDEYRGLNDYAGADVHWVPGRMQCVGCHGAEEMHGDASTEPTSRYEAANMPACTDCHPEVLTQGFGENQWHAMHTSTLQCNVCHSQTYKSCNGCHVGEGITGSSYPTFKIGKNPIPQLRSATYVLLRHIPVAEDTYANWGLASLPDYSDVPTWKYASPHNIRRWTAQTDTTGGKSCSEVCHDTEDSPSGLFLRASDLDGLSAAEQAANQSVVVPSGPPTSW